MSSFIPIYCVKVADKSGSRSSDSTSNDNLPHLTPPTSPEIVANSGNFPLHPDEVTADKGKEKEVRWHDQVDKREFARYVDRDSELPDDSRPRLRIPRGKDKSREIRNIADFESEPEESVRRPKTKLQHKLWTPSPPTKTSTCSEVPSSK